jgi:hypothetical protein
MINDLFAAGCPRPFVCLMFFGLDCIFETGIYASLNFTIGF